MTGVASIKYCNDDDWRDVWKRNNSSFYPQISVTQICPQMFIICPSFSLIRDRQRMEHKLDCEKSSEKQVFTIEMYSLRQRGTWL